MTAPEKELTEEFLNEVLSEVRRWRRASLSDLVPYDMSRSISGSRELSMCSPEALARKRRVSAALVELVRRGVLECSSGYTTTQFWEVSLPPPMLGVSREA